ncbi:MAG TPA: HAMP domain-containing sensor histidine kinase [Acidothermaceae bacterium]|nr:HAMP domain-containing sensor histidine kinase [Acidothermaceae bacterium]
MTAAAPRRRLALSLRARLLAALIALAAIGLVVAAFVTHALLASFLLKRFDDQQASASRFVYPAVIRGGRFLEPGGPLQANRLLPTTSYAAVVDSSGAIVGEWTYNADSNVWLAPTKRQAPQLPGDTFSRTKPFTVTDRDGERFRVIVDHDPNDALTVRSSGASAVAVFAMPLRGVDQTLGRLTRVEAGVTAGVLVALGISAWFAVGVGLRPLRKMEASAGAIAAGDLSRRIEHPDARTEVGRLGLALNTMLGRIEEAFSAQAASEERLRRFLADASHELRTPLTSIRGYAELFRRGAARRPDDLEKAMRRIEDEAARMGLLVDELLLLARLDQGRQPAREPVLLAELAADACDDLRTAAPDRVVRLDADPDAVVNGDEMQLRQVIGNLLTNARVHTPAGTPVDVRVAVEGDKAVVEVTDFGRGLPPQDLPHVFDRFYRADQSRARDHGGAGLGLSIVAAVVQAHGGRVGVLNAPNAGARFRVELSLLEGESDPPEPEPQPSAAEAELTNSER